MTFKTAGCDLMNIKRPSSRFPPPCIELESVVTVIDSKLGKLLAPVMEERKGKKGVVPLCQNAFASCCIILESSWHLISFQLSLYTYLKLRRCYVAAWRYYWIWKGVATHPISTCKNVLVSFSRFTYWINIRTNCTRFDLLKSVEYRNFLFFFFDKSFEKYVAQFLPFILK